MIFVTVGSCHPFTRLISHIDSIAQKIEEEIVVQYGNASPMRHCHSFPFEPSLEKYYKKARLVISHGGFSTLEVLRMRIPLIVVPRLKQYGEHFNDHQLEFAELLYKKFNIKYCVDCAELTECFLMNYNYVAPFSNEHLLEFRKNIKNIFDQQERSFYEISFY